MFETLDWKYMGLNQQIWRIDERNAERLVPSSIEKESFLESWILKDISLLDDSWLIVGCQVKTKYGGKIDVLAIDRNANLIVVELKRDKTPRDIVAQILDYASWVKALAETEVLKIHDEYASANGITESLGDRYKRLFNIDLVSEEINKAHKLVIVAAKVDAATERMVRYLSELGVAINVLFFNVFQDSLGSKLLSRVWFIEPEITNDNAVSSSEKSEWNEEFYVSFGEGPARNWEEARKLGFICAGQGKWYSQTLSLLTDGARIWVNVPGSGYVGVGVVKGQIVPAHRLQILEKTLPEHFRNGRYQNDDSDESNWEYAVQVEWLKTLPLSNATKEVGFFGNQNTVCKPKSKKWLYTIEVLKKKWGIMA